MLIIKNIKWNDFDFKHMTALVSRIKTQLTPLSINIRVGLSEDNKSIIFHELEKNKVMVSRVKNKILMNKDDSRIKKLSREFLWTTKPTRKQYVGFFEAIQTVLDELELDASVVYKFEKEEHLMRNGKENSKIIPKPNSFPIESEG